ncbi:type II toxin-antitoxin system Phd/YefM family antitoxin [Streptomyces sp. NPDC059479]|uniref:type II toxin-antitoxin system Phd/YefM family antitoxin n=1 Tax=Streptomyces sp. NPDC059479 TaxID=3346848 RepID=UPI0036748ABB
MAYEIPVTQARAELADLINRVVYGGERVVVTRHGKPLVALVSAADLERLESGQEAAEERVISSVSAIRSVPSAPGERRRFGIAAEHGSEHRPELRSETRPESRSDSRPGHRSEHHGPARE